MTARAAPRPAARPAARPARRPAGTKAPKAGEVRQATLVDGTPLPFEIRRSAIQGMGAFATRRLRKGQRLAEYEGEHIDQAEADRRYAEAGMRRHHTFLFTLDEDEVIDGKRAGNDSRFINHSCEPNCEAWIDGGRIFIHALKNIQPGTELTYDYQYERTEAHTAEDEQFYACRCGTPSCRGTILAPRKKGRGRTA